MVAGSAGRFGVGLEPEPREIQVICEDVDDANRAVFGYVIIEAFRKQRLDGDPLPE